MESVPAIVQEMENLSVSSVGSEAMQRPRHVGRPPTSGPSFQYPRSDRRRCNQLADIAEHSPQSLFQYPRSDRRRCN